MRRGSNYNNGIVVTTTTTTSRRKRNEHDSDVVVVVLTKKKIIRQIVPFLTLVSVIILLRNTDSLTNRESNNTIPLFTNAFPIPQSTRKQQQKQQQQKQVVPWRNVDRTLVVPYRKTNSILSLSSLLTTSTKSSTSTILQLHASSSSSSSSSLTETEISNHDDPNKILQDLLKSSGRNNNSDHNNNDNNNNNNNDDNKNTQNGLRKAIQYLQAYEKENQGTTTSKLQLSRETWDCIFTAIEERTANAEENTENLRQLQNTIFPFQSMARQEMTEMYTILHRLGQLQLYGAASTVDKTGIVPAAITDTPTAPIPPPRKQLPAGGSYTIPPSLMEEILGMSMIALTPQPTNTLLIAGVAFAVLEGILSLAMGISLNLLVVATIVFVSIDRLLINGAIIETILKLFTPGIQEKVTRHEAGHFLVAYLLGCPVEGIVLSAWGALQDRRFQGRTVSAGTSFFDPDLSYQMNTIQPKLTRSAIDRYSIIVMGGIAAEANYYGRADGGAGDEMALVAFLSQLSSGGSSRGVWNPETIRNQARWGVLQAVLLVRYYKPAYDALVDTLERGNGSLGDCIYAIEKAARDHNLQPIDTPIGYIIEDSQSIQWKKVVPISTSPTTEPESTTTTTTNGNTNGTPPVASLQLPQESSTSSTTTTTITTATTTNEITKSFDPDEVTKSLQKYKEEVQQKLQEVERKLKELQ